MGIPGAQPPWDMVMNSTGQVIFTVFVIIPWVVLIALAARALPRDRQAAPLLFLLGGVCSIVMEPVVDVMGMCFFPLHGQWVGLETFTGRPVPMFMWPVYSWFVGGQAFLLWRMLQRGGMTGQRLWKHWFTAWGVNIVLETPGVLMGVYTYYGAQPFNFWGLPLWWPAVNATMPVVAAFLVHKSWPYLRGWRLAAIVPLAPMADGLVNGGLAWPTWSALHSDIGYAATYPASLVTLGLAMLAVWVMANHLPKQARPEAAERVGVAA